MKMSANAAPAARRYALSNGLPAMSVHAPFAARSSIPTSSSSVSTYTAPKRSGAMPENWPGSRRSELPRPTVSRTSSRSGPIASCTCLMSSNFRRYPESSNRAPTSSRPGWSSTIPKRSNPRIAHASKKPARPVVLNACHRHELRLHHRGHADRARVDPAPAGLPEPLRIRGLLLAQFARDAIRHDGIRRAPEAGPNAGILDICA